MFERFDVRFWTTNTRFGMFDSKFEYAKVLIFEAPNFQVRPNACSGMVRLLPDRETGEAGTDLCGDEG